MGLKTEHVVELEIWQESQTFVVGDSDGADLFLSREWREQSPTLGLPVMVSGSSHSCLKGLTVNWVGEPGSQQIQSFENGNFGA